MFITKKHLSRRTLLRGAGAAIALPLLDSMIPARTALAQTAAAPKTRLGCIYIPHGVTMDKWTPATTGSGFELTEILSPLASVRDQICVVSGLTHAQVAPWSGEDSGGANNHNRAGAVFLSGAHPVKGNRAVCGPSIDQIAAAHIGQDTPIPSIELALEQGGLNCDSGNTCAYINTLAWKSATLPLPMEHNPQVAFSRLFGLGVTDAERAVRRTEASSVLDSVLGQAASLRGALPASDRRVFADYLEEVREVERRVVQVDSLMSSGVELPDPPVGVPDDIEEHLNLMFDLQVLAYKTEITRISTFMFGRQAQQHDFSGQRRTRVLAPRLAPLKRPQEHGYVRGAQPPPCSPADVLPRQAARHTRRRRHAARSRDDPLRKQLERWQPAQLLTLARAVGRRRLGPAAGRSPPRLPAGHTDVKPTARDAAQDRRAGRQHR